MGYSLTFPMPHRQGDIVIVPFPFTDLSGQKQRPAIVISSDEVNFKSEDLILANITSQIRNDNFSFFLDNSYLSAPLPKDSEVRCNKIFTADKSIIRKTISRLLPEHLENLVEKITLDIIGHSA